MSKIAVLISIKPEYVRLIEQGKKTIELRKSYPRRPGDTFKCYIYEVAPVSKVVGEFICSSIEIYLSLFDDGDYYAFCTRIGYVPDVRIYQKQNAPKYLKYLQRWANNRVIYRSCDLWDYVPRADGKNLRQIYKEGL